MRTSNSTKKVISVLEGNCGPSPATVYHLPAIISCNEHMSPAPTTDSSYDRLTNASDAYLMQFIKHLKPRHSTTNEYLLPCTFSMGSTVIPPASHIISNLQQTSSIRCHTVCWFGIGLTSATEGRYRSIIWRSISSSALPLVSGTLQPVEWR